MVCTVASRWGIITTITITMGMSIITAIDMCMQNRLRYRDQSR
jgi:hypothetical protein